jgi:hypothetical protein
MKPPAKSAHLKKGLSLGDSPLCSRSLRKIPHRSAPWARKVGRFGRKGDLCPKERCGIILQLREETPGLSPVAYKGVLLCLQRRPAWTPTYRGVSYIIPFYPAQGRQFNTNSALKKQKGNTTCCPASSRRLRSSQPATYRPLLYPSQAIIPQTSISVKLGSPHI